MPSVFPVTALMFLMLVNNSFAQQANRVALVIGNSKYAGNGFLRNPANDADAMEAALKPLGFTVIKKKDVDLAGMEDAIVSFRQALSKGSVGLFFYAGHGLQVKGENFLVPVGAQMREEFEVKRQCLQLATVLEAMTESESNLKIVVLDCCRDDPFKRSWSRSAGGGGLAALTNVPEGTVIAFATSPDKTAADGKGKNSPYTENLVKVLNTRPETGLELTESFRDASREVKRQTGQIPWLNMEASLDRFYLWSSPDGKVATLGTKRPMLSMDVELKPAEPAEEVSFKLVKEFVFPRITNSLEMELRLIRGGSFMMGSPESEFAHDFEEEILHEVTVTQPFYMATTEVTRSQWTALMKTTPWDKGSESDGDPSLPATFVSWEDAVVFCEKLSALNDAKYDLPNEAQWEFACRANTKTAFWFGDEEADLSYHGWFMENSADRRSPHKVGQLGSNSFGLFDMHGNVAEWCRDKHIVDGAAPSVDSDATDRIVKGGYWMTGPGNCRSASRNWGLQTTGNFSVGFRVVCTAFHDTVQKNAIGPATP